MEKGGFRMPGCRKSEGKRMKKDVKEEKNMDRKWMYMREKGLRMC